MDVGANSPEGALEGVRVAPAQVAVEHVARELVGEQPFGARLNERQAAKPSEQVVRVVEVQGVAQEVLGRHSRERADLQRLALLPVRHVVEEPSQQCADEIRRSRVECRAAAGGHIDEQ